MDNNLCLLLEYRLKLKRTTNENINLINEYLNGLPKHRSEKLVIKMEHILAFYGLTQEEFKIILKEGKVPASFPVNRLSELQSITNAMLLHFIYKKRSNKKKDK